MPYHNIMVINQTGTAWHSPAGNRILAEKRDILLEVKMLTIKDYCLAESIQQAYELNRKKQNKILGGGIWLKCCHFPIQTAIDLSGLGLEGIKETEEGFEIGAMTSLRQLETHEGLNACTCGAVKEALRHIVGTQFRNCATVGGSLFGRFGFSDVLTLFLGLDAFVELYPTGIITIGEFAKMQPDDSILTKIFVKKDQGKTAYLSARNTSTDFPLAACCVSWRKGTLTVSMGARPAKAAAFSRENVCLEDLKKEDFLEEFARDAAASVNFGSNQRASAEYRHYVTKVLIKRCCGSIKKGDR